MERAMWFGKETCDNTISSCLAEQTGSDVTHVGFFQLVVFTAHPIDTNILESGDDGFDIETHGDESVDELLVVAFVRGKLVLLLLFPSLEVLPLDRFSCSTSTALCYFLLWCSGVRDCPLTRLVVELSRISYEHAGNFGILWVFWFGCAEEGLE